MFEAVLSFHLVTNGSGLWPSIRFVPFHMIGSNLYKAVLSFRSLMIGAGFTAALSFHPVMTGTGRKAVLSFNALMVGSGLSSHPCPPIDNWLLPLSPTGGPLPPTNLPHFDDYMP